MDYEEEKFKEHIKAVVEAGQSTDDTIEERPLTLAELKELAISMGLTEEKWNALQAKSHVHLKAADDHLKARNFREAIAEAEKATAINPYIANGNAVLAKSYMMLWLQTHEDEHRDKAELHARKELKVDPRDQIAVNVLSTIDKKKSILAGDSSSRKRVIIGIIVIVVLVVIGTLIYNAASSSKNEAAQISFESEENSQLKNELIVAEEEVIAQWDMVQSAIDRRNKLIPELMNVLNNSTNDSSALNQTITDLQKKIKTAEGEERFKLENDLNAAIDEAKSIASSNQGGENVKNLMVQMETSENRIMYEKKSYNERVKNFNILVKKNADKFPEFEVKPYFNDK